MNNIRFHWKKK